MDEAGALVGFDKARGQQRDIEIVSLPAQRMRCGRFSKRAAGETVRSFITSSRVSTASLAAFWA